MRIRLIFTFCNQNYVFSGIRVFGKAVEILGTCDEFGSVNF